MYTLNLKNGTSHTHQNGYVILINIGVEFNVLVYKIFYDQIIKLSRLGI